MTKCEWIMKVTTNFTRILWANWQVCTQAQAIDKREFQKAQMKGTAHSYIVITILLLYIVMI